MPVGVRKLAVIGLALVVVAVLPGGPGWAHPTSIVARVANYRGADRQAMLEEGARKEGALLMYTSMDLEESQPLVEGFVKKYPFIKGEGDRASGEEGDQKLITEYRGRKYIA